MMSYSWDKSTNPDFQYLFCEKNDNLIALQTWKSMRPGNDPFMDRHRVWARWLPTTALQHWYHIIRIISISLLYAVHILFSVEDWDITGNFNKNRCFHL